MDEKLGWEEVIMKTEIVRFLISFAVTFLFFYFFDFQDYLKWTTIVIISVMFGIFITIFWGIFAKMKIKEK